ncbi:DnaJ family domain-containing protein [Nocardia cyriacigeorgica]|uniref:DnaJ family domain-containing protein n=1 Tax=Nocardia cyriacigeorgica TaxID=135487 RepID=UPI0013D1E500|nr:DUF1992 domain-containing protein [Nocardia cyriacigeorgica]NEW26011.1 DUF1992 domain-containing protein [Nocardia cyriacigeorgica]
MTERKPPDLTFESWIDKQVREATERGEFANLAGAGRPIPGAGTGVDENWWLRDYLRREGVRADGMLPESLVLRREIEQIRETVREFETEREVRRAVSELNQRIVRWIRMPTPPHVPIAPVDADAVLDRWRAERTPAPPARARRMDESGPRTSGRRRWWQRRR